jgi:hypothetical protein
MVKGTITLDLRIGGLGDNWMRLVGFYVAAALRPEYRLRLVLPAKLVRVGRHAFSDRLDIVEGDQPETITYAVRGLRDLLKPALFGARFASPYGRVVINDWNRWTVKDRLNSFALTLVDKVGLIHSPPWASLDHYQGYSEVVTIPAFRSLPVGEFERQLALDYAGIRERLLTAPRSAEFALPDDLTDRAVIFPAGTGYQFVPLEWAKRQMPEAVYAFFHRDPDLVRWREAGLQTIPFYTEPGDMIALASAARVSASTDSFPSHFLQYCAPRFVVMLTELPRHRVVSPAFSGPVVPSLAPCYPCPHLERVGFPKCKAGREACHNWDSSVYANYIHEALMKAQVK